MKTELSAGTTFLFPLMAMALLVQSCDSGRQDVRTDQNYLGTIDRSPTSLKEKCNALPALAVDGLSVNSAEAITDRADLPGFCAIRGVIEPGIGFEARFPVEDWNGKYYQSGCGGYCGALLPDKKGFSNSINEALKQGYAAITTDGGHESWIGDASWARNNPVAVEVYAHKLIPLTYTAGTQLIEAFYQEAPQREYFGGCSNGGRLAAVAAQRYPQLFDGILGGAPVLNLSQNGGTFGSWVVQANAGSNGERLLTRANFAHKLPMLELAVVEQCDPSDGSEDGIISQPRQCTIDFSLFPRCAGTNGTDCFTEEELSVLAAWYQGPRNSMGEQLFPGMPAGSERFLLAWFLDPEGKTAPGNALGGGYARYLGFEGGAPDDFTALDFDFDTDPARLVANGQLFDALDPDLRAFRDAGGKYLAWHGWQDPLVLPDQSVEWYRDIVEEFGDESNVEDFMRLFMIPGKGHCWEMPSAAPDRFDPITVLDNWVESGRAPDQLHVTALDAETSAVPDSVICPYPAAPTHLPDGFDPDQDYCAAD
jgi:feruloyl esterase